MRLHPENDRDLIKPYKVAGIGTREECERQHDSKEYDYEAESLQEMSNIQLLQNHEYSLLLFKE